MTKAIKVEANKPKPLKPFIMDELVRLCSQYIDDILSGDLDSDLEHYIFEEAMEVVFGRDVWKWINENQE